MGQTGLAHFLPQLIAGLLALPLAATPVAPTVEFSQDGRHFQALNLLETAVSPARYYRYHGDAGHPAFGTADDTATASVLWDSTGGKLALLFISGEADGGGGRASVTLTGLPRTSRLTVVDDPGEFTYSPRRGMLTGRYHYGGSTDGFVLGGLQSNSFTARLSLAARTNINTFRLTDSDPTRGGSFIDLNLKKPLYIRVVSVSAGDTIPAGALVPEPSGVVWVALFGISLVRRRAVNMVCRSC